MVGPPSTRRLASTRRPGSTGRWAIYRKRRLRLPGEECRRSPGPALTPALGATGTLIQGVASFDPLSILIAGLLVSGLYLSSVYFLRRLSRRRKPRPGGSVKVSDARLYSRYRRITALLEEAGIAACPRKHPRSTPARGRAARGPDGPAGGDLPLRPLPRRCKQPSSRSSTAWNPQSSPRRSGSRRRSRSGGNAYSSKATSLTVMLTSVTQGR